MKDLHNKVRSLNAHYEGIKAILAYETAYFKNITVQTSELFKVDGSLKKKYEHDRLVHKINHNDYFTESTYYLSLCRSGEGILINVRTCTRGGSYENKTYSCIYEDDQVEIGKEYNKQPLKAEDIERNLLKIEEAKKQYQEAVKLVPYEIRGVLRIKNIF